MVLDAGRHAHLSGTGAARRGFACVGGGGSYACVGQDAPYSSFSSANVV